MNANRRFGLVLVLLFASAACGALFFSRSTSAGPAQMRSAQKTTAASPGDVERGRYLVEDVAMCEECHTPRDENGNLDESRKLEGAQIWIQPVHTITNWANRAPALAGFVGFTDAQGEDILERGIGPNGIPIQPPMHIYHMSQSDALAVIAYLRSLPPVYSR